MLELLEAGQRPTDMAGSETVAWEGQSDQARTYGHRQQPKDARGAVQGCDPSTADNDKSCRVAGAHQRVQLSVGWQGDFAQLVVAAVQVPETRA